MASEAQVLNLTAVAIGTDSRVVSLNEDTRLARTLKVVWDQERQATLRDGSFNFSIARAALPSQAGVDAAVLYPWSARFPLPANCLRILDVLGFSFDSYQVEGRFILARSTGALPVRYIADVPEPSSWDASFANAFAMRLALCVGDRIAGSAFDQAGVQRKYEAAISGARRSDALENPPIEQMDGSWITARHGWDDDRRAGWEMT